ncbi:MAG: HEAT repeat domain-containing protein, partial [Candidatus Heimdallarchaeaceae archaeon]
EKGDVYAVNEMCTILQKGNSVARNHALWGLEQIGGSQVITAILETLNSDKDVFVRRNAADVLGKIGDNQLIAPLKIMLLQEHDELARNKILSTIQKLENRDSTTPAPITSPSKPSADEKFHPICFSCGQENLKNQQFCPFCGGKLSD